MAADDPIPAVRVPAEPSAAGPGPAAASAEEASTSEAAAAVVPAVAVSAAAAAEPAPIELVAERPSLLETVGKDKPAEKPVEAAAKPADKPAEKPAEVKPAEATKPDGDVKPADTAKPEPLATIEYSYALPETLKLDEALKTDLHGALDAFRADPAKGAQALIDLHSKVVGDLVTQNAETTLRNQHKSFNDTRTQWNKDWAADEQIGGAGYQTSLRAIARMRDQFVSAEVPGSERHEADRKSFEEFLRVTGAGDHPAFGRFLHNVARAFDEPALPPANPRPAPNNGAKPGSRRERMYDHPSSSKPL